MKTKRTNVNIYELDPAFDGILFVVFGITKDHPCSKFDQGRYYGIRYDIYQVFDVVITELTNNDDIKIELGLRRQKRIYSIRREDGIDKLKTDPDSVLYFIVEVDISKYGETRELARQNVDIGIKRLFNVIDSISADELIRVFSKYNYIEDLPKKFIKHFIERVDCLEERVKYLELRLEESKARQLRG